MVEMDAADTPEATAPRAAFTPSSEPEQISFRVENCHNRASPTLATISRGLAPTWTHRATAACRWNLPTPIALRPETVVPELPTALKSGGHQPIRHHFAANHPRSPVSSTGHRLLSMATPGAALLDRNVRQRRRDRDYCPRAHQESRRLHSTIEVEKVRWDLDTNLRPLCCSSPSICTPGRILNRYTTPKTVVTKKANTPNTIRRLSHISLEDPARSNANLICGLRRQWPRLV